MGIYPHPFLSKITPSTQLQFAQNGPSVVHTAATNVQAPGLNIEQN